MPFTYSDESDFGRSGEFLGIGLLITDAEIRKEVVESALEKLSDDPDRLRPDRKDLDEKTLRRGYFHASEDSANAHSHFCKAINAIGAGEFACYFFDSRTFVGHRKFIYEQSTTMAALHLSTRDSVTMTFASRAGLSEDTLRSWHKSHERTLAESVHSLPFEPTLFPRCEFRVSSMNAPGLQVADFLLWAHARKNATGDSKWLNAIHAASRTLGTDVGSAFNGGLVLGPLVQPSPSPYTFQDMPPNPDQLITPNDALNFFVSAVRLLIHLQQNGCPPHIEHLKDEIDGIARRVIDPASRGSVEEVAFMYIRLADTLPAIEAGSAPPLAKQRFILSKRLMSLVLRGDRMTGIRTRNWLESNRRLILDKYFSPPQ